MASFSAIWLNGTAILTEVGETLWVSPDCSSIVAYLAGTTLVDRRETPSVPALADRKS